MIIKTGAETGVFSSNQHKPKPVFHDQRWFLGSRCLAKHGVGVLLALPNELLSID